MTIIQFALWDWRDDLELWTAPNGKTYSVPAYVVFIANNGRGALYNLMLTKGLEKYSRYYNAYEKPAFIHIEREALAMAHYIQGKITVRLTAIERRVVTLERRAMRQNPHWSRGMVYQHIVKAVNEATPNALAGAHHVARILETVSEALVYENDVYMAQEAHREAQAKRDMERFAEYEVLADQYNAA